MNSLSYLSRQFDVLASARTPPSTPITEKKSFISSQQPDKPLPRSKTWSKSFLFSSPPKPRRSYSSDFISLTTVSQSSPSTSVSLEAQVVTSSYIDAIFHRIFLVRILSFTWNTLRSAWDSFLELLNSLAPSTNTGIESTSQSPAQESPVSSLEPSVTSRSPTPVLATRKTPFHLPKTLVLDLDETLIHSTSRPMQSAGSSSYLCFGRRNKGAGHVVEVVLGGRSTLYHVYKRPFVDFFLRTVSSWYTLVIFTASMQEYADPVIDWLDAGRGILSNRLFRDSCTQLPNGSYTKDLSIVEPDLARVCLIDNSPISYRGSEANGIPIEGWTHDPSDEALLDLLPVLDSLRFTSDVRRVLGLRIAGSPLLSS